MEPVGKLFGLLVLAAIFVPIERLFALRPQKVFRRGWRTDAVHFLVNNVLVTILLFVAVVIVGTVLRALVPAATRAAIADQPPLLQFAEAFLLAEVCQYWAHRATHRLPRLWRFHALHHSISEMDWLAAARVHPIDQAFTKSCTVLPLYALGFSKGVFGAFLAFTAVQAIAVHANVRVTFGPLRWVFATPEFHHWHHALEVANTNFAGELPLMDVLFGTAHMPKASRHPQAFGIPSPAPDGYLAQMAWPFRTVSA